jgi:hypothetical protein
VIRFTVVVVHVAAGRYVTDNQYVQTKKYRTGSTMLLNSKVPTQVLASKGVKRKWFLGEITLTSYLLGSM